MPRKVRWLLRGLVLVQFFIVGWDALALQEAYGLYRVQPDGLHYLQMAHSLQRGELLRSTPLYEPAPYRWIHEWPLGYPALIATTSTFTGLEPFYAARWLNLLSYALFYLALWRFFRPWAEWLFFLLWPPSLTWSYTMVLSENPYLPLFVATLGLLREEERHKEALFLLLPALFLVRYAGLGTGIGVGLWGLWTLLQGQRKLSLMLIGASAVQAALAVGYFAWNALHDPQGEAGLHLRNAPMPSDFFQRTLEEVTYLRYLGLLVGLSVTAGLWRKQALSLQEKRYFLLLGLLTAVQLAFYLVSMARGRIGLVDARHFVLVFLPAVVGLSLYTAERLPTWTQVLIALTCVTWQVRNTYRHYQRSLRENHLPYTHLKAVQQAYDSLPFGTCIIAGSQGYPVFGRRKDLSLGESDAYWPILLRTCRCLYIDCGDLKRRRAAGLVFKVLWPFVRNCDPPARQPIDLRRIGCADSGWKN